MMNGNSLSDIERYVDRACKNNDVFEIVKLYEVSNNSLSNQHKSYNYEESIRQSLKLQCSYVIKFSYPDSNSLLKTVREVIQQNGLIGSVCIEYDLYGSRALHCSDKITAAILALHF